MKMRMKRSWRQHAQPRQRCRDYLAVDERDARLAREIVALLEWRKKGPSRTRLSVRPCMTVMNFSGLPQRIFGRRSMQKK